MDVAYSFRGQLALVVVFGLPLVAILYLIGIIIYRLCFHPLASYPGPLLAKVTNLYGGYHAWKGDLHIDMARCHEEYGDYVRYAPNRVLVNTNTGLKDIYAYSKNFQKSKVYNAMVHRAPNTLTLIDKRAHGRKRRIISQGFSDSALRSHEPTIIYHVRKLCAQLGTGGSSLGGDIKSISDEAKWSSPQNMAKWSNYLTFDIMSDVIFGEAFNLIEEPTHRHVVEAIERSNVRTSVLIQAAELVKGRLDKRLFKDAIIGRNTFISFVSKLLKARMNAKPLERKDVFSFLLGAKDPETQQGLGMAEIGAESTTLIVAGSDTSSTALASVFFYLTRHPAVYQRVVSEVRSIFSTPSEVGLGPSLNSCTYLRACIDESLRLSPPAGSALWREVIGEGVTIDRQWFPSGTEVGTCIHAIHHNPKYYPQPYEYQPERWLGGKDGPDSGDVLLAKSAFNPFSIGPRGCIGKGLANVELMLALAVLLCQFDFRAAEGPNRRIGEGGAGMGKGRERVLEFQLFDHVTAAKEGPMVEFLERTVESNDVSHEVCKVGES